MLVVSAAALLPDAVNPGSGFDGVVNVFGTGTLLSTGRHILTAAHLFDRNTDGIVDAGMQTVTFDVAGRPAVQMQVPAASITIHNEYNGVFNQGSDIAIMELPALAPFTAERRSIYRDRDEVGQIFSFLGFGSTNRVNSTPNEIVPGPAGTVASGNFSHDGSFGVKRIGFNIVDQARSIVPGSASPFDEALVFDLDAPPGIGLGESLNAPGDSGGPILLGGLIAGVSSGNTDAVINHGDQGFYTRVSSFASWIDDTIGGAFDFVLDMDDFIGADGVADSISLTTSLAFPSVANRLLVSVNGTLVLNELLNAVSSILVRGSSDGETISVGAGLGAIPVSLQGNSGNDSLHINNATGDNALSPSGFTGGSHNIVQIAGIESLNFNGSAGNEKFYVNTFIPFDLLSITSLRFNGGAGSDTLFLGSGKLDWLTVPINFHGGGGVDDRVDLNDQAATADTIYNITALAVSSDLWLGDLDYSDLDNIVINAGSGADTVTVGSGVAPLVAANGNNGNDKFIIGGGNMTGYVPQLFHGGFGIDQITFDDRFDPTSRIWDIRPGEVLFGGLLPLATTSFESVGVIGGTNGDEFNFTGLLAQNLDINGGDGFDRFLWHGATNRYLLDPVPYTVNLNGGGDINQLQITQANQGSLNFNVTGSRMYVTDYFGATPDINYANFIGISLTTGPQSDRFNVYETDASSNYSINGGDGADYFYLQTDPDKRNYLTLNGQAGNDTLSVDDSVYDTTDVPYSFNAGSGIFPDSIVRNTGPLTITTYGYTSMQSVIVGGTKGANTFDVAAFNPNGPLAIHGWAGDDVLNVSGAVVRLSPSNSLTFHGNDDYDTFNMLDSAAGSTAYNVFEAVFRRNSTDVPLTTTERINIAASPLNDDLFITALAPGQLVNFDGGEGNDRFLTSGTSADGVRGPVIFDGQGGTDNRVLINDQSDTTGDTVHIDQTTVGALPGDNLFGPGGSLEYSGVAMMTIGLGSGDDVVYSMPHPLTKVKIEGNEPTASDFLGLAFADASNPLFTPGATGNGGYTFDNAASIDFTGMESAVIDDVAPQIVAQNYDDTSTPAIRVQFSEDVSNALSVNHLELINSSTNEPTPFGLMAITNDVATNTASFTFPGYPDGVLPPGDYTAKIFGSVSDLFGNRMGVETPFNFTVELQLPALLGDYNQNGEVDAVDYVVWRRALGEAIANYSGADGSGNGTVDGADYDVWRAHFGETLPLTAENGASTFATRAEPVISVVTARMPPSAQFQSQHLALNVSASERRSLLAARPRNALTPQRATIAIRQDDLLAAWLATIDGDRQRGDDRFDQGPRSEFQDGPDDVRRAALDRALEWLGQLG